MQVAGMERNAHSQGFRRVRAGKKIPENGKQRDSYKRQKKGGQFSEHPENKMYCSSTFTASSTKNSTFHPPPTTSI